MPKLIIILGPTASGKTKLAVKLASQFKAEIISADSRQVYKGMDIGTGKDLKAYKKIPYHLINLKNPKQSFSLGEFQKLCFKTIDQIHQQNKIPFLVGGTGLYISSIIHNYQIPKVKPNQKIRLSLAKLSLDKKIKLLKKLDPAALKFVDLKNHRRLDRALEVCLSDKKFSETRQQTNSPYNILALGINQSPARLKTLINQRVDKMLDHGLVNETKRIIKKYGPGSAPLQTIGYAEIINYLNKKTTLDQAVELIKIHTRQFAKRQMTWFKKEETIHWLKTPQAAQKLIKDFLT